MNDGNESDKTLVSMVFDSLEASHMFWFKYGCDVGFSTKFWSTRKSKAKTTMGVINSRDYACSRRGCLSTMKVKLIGDTSKFKITSVVKEHNHPLEEKLKTICLRSHGNITDNMLLSSSSSFGGIHPMPSGRHTVFCKRDLARERKKAHLEEPNYPAMNLVVDGPVLSMSIDCTRDNKLEDESNTHEKADETKLLSENVENIESMVTDNIHLSDDEHSNTPKSVDCVIPSQQVSNFENCKIIVNGSIVDSELSHEIRKKYFDLCSKRRSVLHSRFLTNVSDTLAAAIISETTKISESIRDCNLETCEDNLRTWDKALAGFEMLGMDVFFYVPR